MFPSAQKSSPDMNLDFIPCDNPGGHLSCHGHLGSTSFDVGGYEKRLNDPDGFYSSVHSDPIASSFGVSVDLNEEPGSLFHFLRDRRRAVMEGRFRLDLSIETEIALLTRLSRSWTVS